MKLLQNLMQTRDLKPHPAGITLLILYPEFTFAQLSDRRSRSLPADRVVGSSLKLYLNSFRDRCAKAVMNMASIKTSPRLEVVAISTMGE
jgi:hypothetical protein